MRRFIAYTWMILVAICFSGGVVSALVSESDSFLIEDGSFSDSGGYATSSSFQMFSLTNEIGGERATGASFVEGSGTTFTPTATAPVLSVTSGEEQLSVSWTSSTATFATVTNYRVGIATSSGGTYTFTSMALATSKVFSGLIGGTTYYVKVQVYDGDTLLTTSSVVSGTPTAAESAPTVTSSSGGGSLGGDRDSNDENNEDETTLTVSGRAYPWSTVILLRGAVQVATTVAGPDAQFTITTQQAEGNYNYTIYTTDSDGRRSSTFSFNVGLSEGTSTQIGGIFIPPTIAVDKKFVEWGESIPILGQGAPNSTVDIFVYSTPVAVQTQAGRDGTYLYQFDTSLIEVGDHSTKAKSKVGTEVSSLSQAATFKVVNPGELPEEPEEAEETEIGNDSDCNRGDLNCDTRVNLVDFSIAAYWYQRALEATIVDREHNVLNGDGKIDLVDLSIIAYYWTA